MRDNMRQVRGDWDRTNGEEKYKLVEELCSPIDGTTWDKYVHNIDK